jgi:3-methyladenine DNA glycosylase AlkD
MTAREVQARLRKLASPRIAAINAWFFKTGPGQYGEGDEFIGLRAAALHAAAGDFRDLPLPQVRLLLRSRVHEDRGVALLILVRKFRRADESARRAIFNFYLANADRVNNWDLVDASAPAIVGGHLAGRGDRRAVLDRLARSANLWERRIAIVATLHLIRLDRFADTFRIARRLLADRHDLIHKATGWMLREAGKRDRAALEGFLRRHCRRMPRTMLRYAIERFPARLRRAYLDGKPG